MFQQFSQTNFYVPGLAGPMEHVFIVYPLAVFYSTQFWLSKSIKSNFELYMVLFSKFLRSNFLPTGPNTHRVCFPVSLRGNRPGNTLFGLVNKENWRCNRIDMVVLQLQGYRKCGRVVRHAFVSAIVNFHCTSSRSPYIASLVELGYRTL